MSRIYFPQESHETICVYDVEVPTLRSWREMLFPYWGKVSPMVRHNLLCFPPFWRSRAAQKWASREPLLGGQALEQPLKEWSPGWMTLVFKYKALGELVSSLKCKPWVFYHIINQSRGDRASKVPEFTRLALLRCSQSHCNCLQHIVHLGFSS